MANPSRSGREPTWRYYTFLVVAESDGLGGVGAMIWLVSGFLFGVGVTCSVVGLLISTGRLC